MLAKLLFFVTIINLTFGMDIEIPRKDLVVLESGERVEGRIEDITDGIIVVKTDHGEKTIVRDVNIYSPRDIVETGIIRNKRHSGYVRYFGDVIELHTSSGKQTFKRALVRKIIISHEASLPPLDL